MPNRSATHACSRMGVPLVEGDATDPEILLKAGVSGVGCAFVVCDTDETNIQVVYQQSKTAHSAQMVCCVGLRSQRNFQILQSAGRAGYVEAIATGVNAADAVSPVLSKNSVASRWVVREVTYAMERGKPIIPVFMEFAAAPGRLEFAIAGIHRIDVSAEGWEEDPWRWRVISGPRMRYFCHAFT